MNYDLSEKTIVVTGANSGIGKAASIQLAKLGAHVVMMCRNKERGEQALRDVRSDSDSDKVELILVDMSSQASVRDAVYEFLDGHSRLDVIIHNASNQACDDRRWIGNRLCHQSREYLSDDRPLT